MKIIHLQVTATALALLILSSSMLNSQDKVPLTSSKQNEVMKIQERTAMSNQFEDETLQQMLKLTAYIKGAADPKSTEEIKFIELEELLGRACYIETRTFAAYNDPTSLVRRSVPADEKTITKKIMDQLKEAREESQKAIKFFREKKYGPAALKIKEIDKKLQDLPRQFEARRKIRAARIEEKTKQ